MRSLRCLGLAVALGALSCGSPTAPAPAGATVGAAYLEEVVRLLETHSFRKAEVNWGGVRQLAQQQTRNANSPADAEQAISLALQTVNDHSIYQHTRNGGATVSVAWSRCSDAPWSEIGPRDGIGYLVVYGFYDGLSDPVGFAQEIQDAIAAQDRASLSGWIVDLRGISGTSIWPSIAGLGPLLGEGALATSVDAAGRSVAIEYRAGAVRRDGEAVVSVPRPHLLKSPPRIAVLTSRASSTAGQAAVVAFRGRARVFGTETCGPATEYRSFPLSDGAVLHVSAALMHDRTGRAYAAGVSTDETIASPAAAAERAIAWVREGR